MNSTQATQLFQQVYDHARETSFLESTLALLEWDEHTGLPEQAGLYRADQVTFLSGLTHKRKTDPKLGEWLSELSNSELAEEPNSVLGASIRGWKRDFDRNIQLPESLVKRTAHAISVGQQIWASTKGNNDFDTFLPYLKEIVSLRREEATLLAQNRDCRYDGLLDQYEEEATTAEVDLLFIQLRDQLVNLVQTIGNSEHGPTGRSLQGTFDIEKQKQLSRWVAEKIGYQFERGRLDETQHPFCTALGPNDHRILTRYFQDSFSSGLYGTLHEAGHAMYEQGLPTDWFGMPAGSAASLGVHESQSRLWENMIGRSHAFWQWCLPEAVKVFPQLEKFSIEQIYGDLNRVAPSLIRIEADEATYNLHILIRFELERELIDGDLACEDLPQAWSDRYQSYLGIRPANHSEGVMQDVHWAAGLIGYFPTYTLGNIFAAQLMGAAEQELGELDGMISQGDFRPLLEWLRAKVHRHGRCFKPTLLISNACHAPLSSRPLMDYLEKKLKPLYQIS